MTQYSDRVERVRLKQEAKEWGEGIKYIHASDGLIETAYFNGNTHFQENWEGGKNWTVYSQKPFNLIDKFLKWRSDGYGKR